MNIAQEVDGLVSDGSGGVLPPAHGGRRWAGEGRQAPDRDGCESRGGGLLRRGHRGPLGRFGQSAQDADPRCSTRGRT